MGNKRAAGWNYNRLPLPNVCPPLPRTLLPLTPHPFHPAVIFGTSMVTSSSSRVLSSFSLHACCYMCRKRMKTPLNHKVIFQHPVIFTHDCTLARLCIPHHYNSAASLQLSASSRNKQQDSAAPLPDHALGEAANASFFASKVLSRPYRCAYAAFNFAHPTRCLLATEMSARVQSIYTADLAIVIAFSMFANTRTTTLQTIKHPTAVRAHDVPVSVSSNHMRECIWSTI